MSACTATALERTNTDLVTTIPGLSAVGAAAILAETGDPMRFDSARALVKHAGLAPRDNESGTFKGTSRISGRGRPGLRLAVWRAVWGALPRNAVYAERYRHLTTRETNRLTDHQARVAIGAALLRQLHAVIVHRTAWKPRHRRRREGGDRRRLNPAPDLGQDELSDASRPTRDLATEHEQSCPSSHQARMKAVGQPPPTSHPTTPQPENRPL